MLLLELSLRGREHGERLFCLRRPISAEIRTDGLFSLATPRSGVPEIDAIASSLDRSAQRVEELLRAERSFSEHASHQLRTALTGLQLRLEELASSDDPAVREEAEAALVQSARLLSTIAPSRSSKRNSRRCWPIRSMTVR